MKIVRDMPQAPHRTVFSWLAEGVVGRGGGDGGVDGSGGKHGVMMVVVESMV